MRFIAKAQKGMVIKMEEKAVALSGLSVGYGGKVIVDNINIDFLKGKMICILGANGAGKTTILKTISRIIPKLKGTVQLGGKPLHKIRAVDRHRKWQWCLPRRSTSAI